MKVTDFVALIEDLEELYNLLEFDPHNENLLSNVVDLQAQYDEALENGLIDEYGVRKNLPDEIIGE